MAGGAHSFCRVYIDHLVIYSDTFEDHLHHVDQVLKILLSVGLKVHPGKPIFGAAALNTWVTTSARTCFPLWKPKQWPSGK